MVSIMLNVRINKKIVSAEKVSINYFVVLSNTEWDCIQLLKAQTTLIYITLIKINDAIHFNYCR